MKSPTVDSRPFSHYGIGRKHPVPIVLGASRTGVIRQNAHERPQWQIRWRRIAARSGPDNPMLLVCAQYNEIGIRYARFVTNETVALVEALAARATIGRQRHPTGVDNDATLSALMADDGG